MMFETAIARVLGIEGGYTPGADDPGGETKWGISKRSYPDLDIKALTREEAVEIYRKDFWFKARCDLLPDSVAFQALDFAVNSGIVVATMALQRAAGVAADGVVGPVTLSALVRVSAHDLICLLLAERLEFMTGLSNWPLAGRGWARRVARDLRYGAIDA